MSKRKPGPSEHCKQKLLQAQLKKDFIRKVKSFTLAFAGQEALKHLSSEYLERICKLHVLAPRIYSAEGSNIPEKTRKVFEDLLNWYMKNKLVPYPDGSNVPLSEYYSVGLTMNVFIDWLKTERNEVEFQRFGKLFGKFQEYYDSLNCPLSFLIDGLEMLCWSANDIALYHFWLEGQYNDVRLSKFGTQLPIRLSIAVANKTRVEVNNQMRPAVRLAWCTTLASGLHLHELKPSQLGVKGMFADLKWPVYIQAHALARLKERLDCISFGFVQLSLHQAMLDPKVIFDSKGKALIEFYISNYKVGYIRADAVGACILIRTFLFLTNNGTPEGEMLAKFTGLGKLDKKYLAVDKLSAFISSDLCTNPSVKELLRKTGCKCLIDLFENHKTVIAHSKNKDDMHTAARLSQYLQLEKQEEPEWEEVYA